MSAGRAGRCRAAALHRRRRRRSGDDRRRRCVDVRTGWRKVDDRQVHDQPTRLRCEVCMVENGVQGGGKGCCFFLRLRSRFVNP